jgi:hypothetical protein
VLGLRPLLTAVAHTLPKTAWAVAKPTGVDAFGGKLYSAKFLLYPDKTNEPGDSSTLNQLKTA